MSITLLFSTSNEISTIAQHARSRSYLEIAIHSSYILITKKSFNRVIVKPCIKTTCSKADTLHGFPTFMTYVTRLKRTACQITSKHHYYHNVVSPPSASINSLCSLMYSITSSQVRYFIDKHLFMQSLKFSHT